MPGKRSRPKHKKEDEKLPAPGERQLARLPDWWESADPMELERAHVRARQLREGGWGAITWHELTGRR